MMAAPAKKIFRRPDWLAAAGITVAIIWLHFYLLFHAGGFWRDEVNSINLASRHSLAEMQKDSFPILMPLLISGWSALGLAQNDLSLRLLGALIGLGLPTALWVAAWTAHRSPPLISLVFLGLNMTMIYYGDSIRAYGLGSVFIVLALAAMWAFLKTPTWGRLGILIIAAVLSVQSLYQNAVLIAAICSGAWVVCARRKNFQIAMKVLLAGVAAALSLLPYWKSIRGMPEAAASMRMGFMPGIAFDNLDTVVAFPLPFYLRAWEGFALAVIGFGCASFFIRAKEAASPDRQPGPEDLPLFAGAVLLATGAAFAGFLCYAGLVTQPWYFLPPVALLAACFELGLMPASLPRTFRVAFWGFIMATALVAVPSAQRDLDWRFTNVDLLARQLTAQAAPQDFIIVSPWYCGISFGRYFKNTAQWETVPPLADHSTHRYDLLHEQMNKPRALQPVLDRIGTTLQSGHRVWIVGTISLPPPGTPPPPDLPPESPGHPHRSDTLYSYNCLDQTAWFLANHSVNFERADHATNRNINIYENLQLFSASGWKP